VRKVTKSESHASLKYMLKMLAKKSIFLDIRYLVLDIFAEITGFVGVLIEETNNKE